MASNRKITDIFKVAQKKDKSSSDVSSVSTTSTSTAEPEEVPSSSAASTVLPYRPPKSFTFPKTKIGDRSRSCQHQWFDEFPWLHYDTRYIYD